MRVAVYAECIYVLTEYLKYLAYKGIVIFGKMWVGLKRAGCCVSVLWLCQLCLCLFQQLINTTHCLAFLRKFVCQPLCCVPLQTETFYQNLILITEYHVDC